MTAHYIEAPNSTLPAIGDLNNIVFLAGGITNCPDWQSYAAKYLLDYGISVLNPRREDFDVTDKAAERAQIEWEYRALRAADLILFWFTEGPSVQPITLYELGDHGDGIVVVGTHPDYPRRSDVIEQLRLKRPLLTVHDTLDATLRDAVSSLT